MAATTREMTQPWGTEGAWSRGKACLGQQWLLLVFNQVAAQNLTVTTLPQLSSRNSLRICLGSYQPSRMASQENRRWRGQGAVFSYKDKGACTRGCLNGTTDTYTGSASNLSYPGPTCFSTFLLLGKSSSPRKGKNTHT